MGFVTTGDGTPGAPHGLTGDHEREFDADLLGLPGRLTPVHRSEESP